MTDDQNMAQPSPVPPPANGVSASPESPSDSPQLSLPGKRKRDDGEGDEVSAQQQETSVAVDNWAGRNSGELLKYYRQVLAR